VEGQEVTKSHPILFTCPMVLAILDGRKSQTRRLVKPQPVFEGSESYGDSWSWRKGCDWFSGVTTTQLTGKTGLLHESRCPHAVGDTLWVRETTRSYYLPNLFTGEPTNAECGQYVADGAPVLDPMEFDFAWWYSRKVCPAIHMPRWASRITLEVTDVRVQRLQDIGKDGRKAHDVLAEGITQDQIEHWRKWLHPDDAPAHTYGVLWESINGKGSWARNEWVWAYTFKRLGGKGEA